MRRPNATTDWEFIRSTELEYITERYHYVHAGLIPPGMTWEIEGGQVIVELRTIWLSGVWDKVHDAYLAAKPLSQTGTQQGKWPKPVAKAA